MSEKKNSNISWQEKLFLALKREGIKQVSFVPDAGHSQLINFVIADPSINAVALTTEEEGVALSCGAWLGGQKSVLLMQSSGVGNCVNMFSILKSCEFPFLTIITMRGEFEEFNSWQNPMGSATQSVLQLMDFEVHRVDKSEQISLFVKKVLGTIFLQNRKVAILLSQKFIGKKEW